MHPTPLKAGMEHLGGGGTQALVVIRDHQLDPAQATVGQRTQEALPEHLRLRGARGDTEHLAPAIRVHADGDYRRGRDDAPSLARLHVGGVDPDIRPLALEGAIEEGVHPAIDLLHQPADLALGDARAASNSHWPYRRTGIIVRAEPQHGAAVLSRSGSA